MADTTAAVREAREQLRQINELIKTNQEHRHADLVNAKAREDDIDLLSSRRDSWEQLLKDAEMGAATKSSEAKDDAESSKDESEKDEKPARKTATKKAAARK